MRHRVAGLIAFTLGASSVFAQGEGLVLTSTAFAAAGDIPRIHACHAKGGENQSLPLSWSGAPSGTARYAIIMDDETSPCRTGDGACRHWMVYNLPATTSSLQAGQAVSQIPGVSEGRSYSGRIGYDGMCPPGPHVYKISLYALKDGMPDISAETALTRSQFAREYSAYILGTATLIGNFSPW